jgi:hypothetical protein
MSVSEQLIGEILAEFPRFRIVPKAESQLSWLIDRALRILTLGRQRRFLSHYHTVIGDTLYVPTGWDSTSDLNRAILLRHERVHLRQRRRLGLPLMAFLYLIPWLPLGLAWGRARLEWEAYTETLRATAELLGLEAVRRPDLRAEIIGRFTGPDYGWMWPFERQVSGWYDEALAEIEAMRGPTR